MTKHITNLKAFVGASNNISDPILKAYCGLVAIELELKDATGLKNHDVPAHLNRFATKYAIDHLSGCGIKLNSLSTQLQNNLTQISVQDKDQKPCPAPKDSYPYIRYTRLAADGWPAPSTSLAQAQDLANTVQQIQTYLRRKFNKSL